MERRLGKLVVLFAKKLQVRWSWLKSKGLHDHDSRDAWTVDLSTDGCRSTEFSIPHSYTVCNFAPGLADLHRGDVNQGF